jgi:hypothetical protein
MNHPLDSLHFGRTSPTSNIGEAFSCLAKVIQKTNTKTHTISIIYHPIDHQHIPDDCKKTPGAVGTLAWMKH